MNFMRSVALILFIIVAFLFSCENNGSIGVNCSECYTVRPDSADLVIYLTINSDNPRVPLKFYRGNVEKNQVDWVDTSYSKEFRLYSKIDQFYSVEATYKDGTRKIIAVDGDKLTLSLITDACDADCWIIKGGVMDVRLKNP